MLKTKASYSKICHSKIFIGGEKLEKKSFLNQTRSVNTKVILADKFGETEKLKHTGKVRAKWHLISNAVSTKSGVPHITFEIPAGHLKQLKVK